MNTRRHPLISLTCSALIVLGLLNRERSYTRKFKEAMLARRLEERYPKRAILEAYLNRIYFGDGYYGIEAAAIGYFGKRATHLDAVESATLAGLIKGPSLYSPTKAPELARKRRDLVLGEMRDQGMLSDQEYQAAVAVPARALIARGDRSGVPDPRHTRGAEYFRDAVARELLVRGVDEQSPVVPGSRTSRPQDEPALVPPPPPTAVIPGSSISTIPPTPPKPPGNRPPGP